MLTKGWDEISLLRMASYSDISTLAQLMQLCIWAGAEAGLGWGAVGENKLHNLPAFRADEDWCTNIHCVSLPCTYSSFFWEKHINLGKPLFLYPTFAFLTAHLLLENPLPTILRVGTHITQLPITAFLPPTPHGLGLKMSIGDTLSKKEAQMPGECRDKKEIENIT